MATILSIDQGTSGTKAIVVDGDDQIIGFSETPVEVQYLDGGGVEQDPQELIDSVLATGREAIAQAGRPVDYLTVTTQGEAVLAWDENTGEPLTDVIGWQDRRAEPICAELAEHADFIARKTGLVLDSIYNAVKRVWIRRTLTAEGTVGTIDTWLVRQLTGESVSDVSTASKALLLDLDTTEWDDRLIEVFGLEGETLPQVVPTDVTIGQTDLFGGVVPVGGLIEDQQAALFAEGCLAAGDAKCTFGTGAFLLANVGTTARRSSHGLSACAAWTMRGTTTYALDGQVLTAASAVRWLKKVGLIQSHTELDALASDADDAVLCVPALAGLGSPWWNGAARATFRGVSLSTGRGELVAAVLKGIAAQVAVLGKTVEQDLGAPLQRLSVDGGLTKSTVLMQAVSDLLQIPIDVYPSNHATPLGAVAMARLAMEPGLRPEEAMVAWTPARTFEPRWSSDRAGEFLGRWSEAAEAA